VGAARSSAGRKDVPNGEVADRDTAMANGDVDEGDEDAVMRRMMGFEAFKTTKNTKVPGNDKNYGVRKDKKTKYRQYMNRQGGFNRPLSPS
jgi:U4/U6.U5 tri-snRNP-associated protein 3